MFGLRSTDRLPRMNWVNEPKEVTFQSHETQSEAEDSAMTRSTVLTTEQIELSGSASGIETATLATQLVAEPSGALAVEDEENEFFENDDDFESEDDEDYEDDEWDDEESEESDEDSDDEGSEDDESDDLEEESEWEEVGDDDDGWVDDDDDEEEEDWGDEEEEEEGDEDWE